MLLQILAPKTPPPKVTPFSLDRDEGFVAAETPGTPTAESNLARARVMDFTSFATPSLCPRATAMLSGAQRNERGRP